MQPILPSAAALAVAVIFYTWRAWNFAQYRRRALHERVAYMLWVVATTEEGEVAAAH